MAAADTARRLIAKHGRLDGVLRRPSQDNVAPAGRPWAPEDSAPAVDPIVAQALAVVVLNAAVVARPGLTLADGTSAVAYLDATVEPLTSDILETKGDRYIVLQVDELSPGAATALYTLHLKAS